MSNLMARRVVKCPECGASFEASRAMMEDEPIAADDVVHSEDNPPWAHPLTREDEPSLDPDAE